MIAVSGALSLDGEWEFQHDPAGDLTPAGLAATRPIQVPGPWQAQFDDLRLVSGVGWYRRHFLVPDDWRGAVVRLHFGAVDYFAEVWLNGARLGSHEGGYLPFAFEIQDHLGDDGPNELVVRVIDPGLDTDETFPEFRFGETPHGKQNWYGPTGGLWQSVTLERRGNIYVNALVLGARPNDERVDVTCQLTFRQQANDPVLPPGEPSAASPLPVGEGPWKGAPGEGVPYADDKARCSSAAVSPHPSPLPWGEGVGRLRVQVYSHTGALVGEATAAIDPNQADYHLSIPVPSPERWDVDNPALYRATAVVSAADSTVDRVEDSFGFRTIETRDGAIVLNGRLIYLRGALDQDYYPGTICTAPSGEFIADRFRKAKELGLNCLRCHIKAPDPRYLAWADRLGLLVWYDLPSWGARSRPGTGYGPRTPIATERALATLEGMIQRDGNHPSIVCWTIVNEDWGTRLPNDAADRTWLRETYDWLKRRDPSRLVVDNSPCHPNFHVKSDLDDYHFYRGIPDHAEQWSATIAEFAGRPAWSFSQHGDAVRRGDEPLVVSEFGNWGLPNVDNLMTADGREPWWFATGENWGSGRTRGLVHPKGVRERFTALGLADVFGSYEAFVAASQEQEHQALAYEIADLRRHASIKGYVITELTDVHWECNGLLDLGNNPKAFHHTLGQINADDVIVPEITPPYRRSFWEGDEIAIGISVSHFSQHAIEHATVRWWLETGDPPATSHTIEGSFPDVSLARGETRAIGTICFQAPNVAAPSRVTLRLELQASSPKPGASHFPLPLGEGQGEGVPDPSSTMLVSSQSERPHPRPLPEGEGVDSLAQHLAATSSELYLYPRELRRTRIPRSLHVVGAAERAGELAGQLAELGYSLVDDWRRADATIGVGFDQRLQQIAREGGRVLALIEDVASVTAELGSLEIVEREGTGYAGDWASSFSWLYSDRLAHRIPSGPRLDWAFATVAPDQVICGLSAEELRQNALAGLFLGWIQKPAALAVQLRIGPDGPPERVAPEGRIRLGKLILTTLRLARPRGSALGADPAATVLFHDLVEQLLG